MNTTRNNNERFDIVSDPAEIRNIIEGDITAEKNKGVIGYNSSAHFDSLNNPSRILSILESDL